MIKAISGEHCVDCGKRAATERHFFAACLKKPWNKDENHGFSLGSIVGWRDAKAECVDRLKNALRQHPLGGLYDEGSVNTLSQAIRILEEAP